MNPLSAVIICLAATFAFALADRVGRRVGGREKRWVRTLAVCVGVGLSVLVDGSREAIRLPILAVCMGIVAATLVALVTARRGTKP